MDINTRSNAILEGLLVSLGFSIDDGAVLNAAGAPVKIGGKEVYLPTRALMKEADWDNKIAFTPLSENGLRGESPVQKRMLKWINAALNLRAKTAMQLSLELIKDEAIHKTFNRQQRDIVVRLAALGKFGKTHVSRLKALIKEADNTPFVHLYCGRTSPNADDKHVRRYTKVNIPLHDLEGTSEYGTFSASELRMFESVITYILPDEINYDAASTCINVPYSESVLTAYANVSEELNRFFAKYIDWLPLVGADIADVRVDVDFVNMFGPSTNASLRTLHPITPGNEGELRDNTPVTSAKDPKLSYDAVIENRSLPQSAKLNNARPAPAAAAVDTTPKEKSVTTWAERKQLAQRAQAPQAYGAPQYHQAIGAANPPTYNGRPLRRASPILSGEDTWTDESGKMLIVIRQGILTPVDQQGNPVQNAPVQQNAPLYPQQQYHHQQQNVQYNQYGQPVVGAPQQQQVYANAQQVQYDQYGQIVQAQYPQHQHSQNLNASDVVFAGYDQYGQPQYKDHSGNPVEVIPPHQQHPQYHHQPQYPQQQMYANAPQPYMHQPQYPQQPNDGLSPGERKVLRNQANQGYGHAPAPTNYRQHTGHYSR